jgi:hypothetical protein
MSFPFADAFFWIAGASCTIAQCAILRSVIASPVRPADASPRPSKVRRVAEIAWAVLPGLALIVVFTFTWRAMHAVQLGWPVAGSVAP